jgi:hypothetical protein
MGRKYKEKHNKDIIIASITSRPTFLAVIDEFKL